MRSWRDAAEEREGTAMAVTTPTTTRATTARIAFHTTVREMPEDERPRERLLRYGPPALQTTELLAIILWVGTRQENVVEPSARLLREFGGLGGLASVEPSELCGLHAMGEAKATQLKAALELGHRLGITGPDRPQISRPDDVATLLMLWYTTIIWCVLPRDACWRERDACRRATLAGRLRQ
jgi:hypothetical protein